jgi:16S rRNA (cytosine967-C5)-methyltransferase
MKDFNARWVAYQVLKRLESRQSNSTILLQETLVKVADPKDRNFITDLVLGTIRWRKRLLFLIDQFSKRPVNRLDPEVVLILQLGLYQLLYSNIPPHAAIYETVKLCKIARLTSASSFVNGILRGVQGKMHALPDPLENALAIRWSHPEWLVNRWVNRFGEQAAVALMQVNNQPPPVFLHINTLTTTTEDVKQHLLSEGVLVEATTFGPSVVRVKEGAPQGTRSFLDGEFYIQDAAVHLLAELMSAKPNTRILEIAAAPGGKTVQLAFRVCLPKSSGFIVAVDSDLRRMRTWQRNMQRMKIPCVYGVLADARRLPLQDSFDQVIIDAPCSTIGVIRRHPEVKWWRQESDLPNLAALQLQILNACAKYVRSQGELIYSVCSFEPEETEQVSEAFLKENPNFSKLRDMMLLPHRDHTDGFYIVKFLAK